MSGKRERERESEKREREREREEAIDGVDRERKFGRREHWRTMVTAENGRERHTGFGDVMRVAAGALTGVPGVGRWGWTRGARRCRRPGSSRAGSPLRLEREKRERE